jgi:hypothetical protein
MEQMKLELDERKFDVRQNPIDPNEWWIWRLNYPFRHQPKSENKDRIVAGPYISRKSAQSAIDERRITCL